MNSLKLTLLALFISLVSANLSQAHDGTEDGYRRTTGAAVHEVFDPNSFSQEQKSEKGPENFKTSALTTSSLSQSTPAEKTVEVYLSSGDPKNRLDLAFVSDGFVSPAEFRKAAVEIANHFFEDEPVFNAYKGAFNVYFVYLPSSAGETVLNTRHGCFGVERLLCTNPELAKQSVSEINPDHIIVLANSKEYGGAAYVDSGVAVVAGLADAAAEIAAHEYGHLFGLMDQYAGAQLDQSNSNFSRFSAATMLEQQVDWYTKLGTTDRFTGGVIAAYPFLDSNSNTAYRPTPKSKMSELGQLFDEISVAVIIRRLSSFCSLIDSIEKRNAEITVRTPKIPTLKITWRSGAKRVKSCANKNTCQQPKKSKRLTVSVFDSSPWVSNTAGKAHLIQSAKA